MTLSTTLALAVLLAAKPVAKTYRGPLDDFDVSQQSSGVIAKFEEPDKAKAQATLDSVAAALKLLGAVRVSFLRTTQGTFAAVILETPTLKFGRCTELARLLSKKDGVNEAWAYVTAGPRNQSLEGEATFAFVHGEAGVSQRLQYRDDPKYLELVRRKIPASTWRLARWPDYPISALTLKLGLPGRAVLDFPWELPTVATTPAPNDAGENLVLTSVELPGGMTTEIQQLALRDNVSMSKEVTDALKKARDAKTLTKLPTAGVAAYDEGQPDAEKHARRELTVYLPAEEQESAQDAGDGQSISLSRIVQYAWRQAHPIAPTPVH
jgi:hypothetical protein